MRDDEFRRWAEGLDIDVPEFFPPGRVPDAALLKIMPAPEWRGIEQAAVLAWQARHGEAATARTRSGYGGMNEPGPTRYDNEATSEIYDWEDDEAF